MFQFTFPESDKAHIIVQAINITENKKAFQGYLKINEEKQEIIGYNPQRMSSHLGPELPGFKGYFVISFDKPFESSTNTLMQLVRSDMFNPTSEILAMKIALR